MLASQNIVGEWMKNNMNERILVVEFPIVGIYRDRCMETRTVMIWVLSVMNDAPTKVRGDTGVSQRLVKKLLFLAMVTLDAKLKVTSTETTGWEASLKHLWLRRLRVAVGGGQCRVLGRTHRVLFAAVEWWADGGAELCLRSPGPLSETPESLNFKIMDIV